jgi:hypothetical protein
LVIEKIAACLNVNRSGTGGRAHQELFLHDNKSSLHLQNHIPSGRPPVNGGAVLGRERTGEK